MLTLVRWRQILLRLLTGSVAHAALFLGLSLPFAPDLGDASFESRAFLGSLVAAYPLAFATGAVPVFLAALFVGVLSRLVTLGLGFAARTIFPVALAFLALARMAMDHPALASEWFLYQRSATMKMIVQWLSSLPTDSPVRVGASWAPFALAIVSGVASLVTLGGWLLAQHERFQRVKRGFRIDELDLQSRRYAISGVALGLSASATTVAAVFLWSPPRASAPRAPDRLARPHAFLFLVDGLRRQVIEPGAQERTWAPFLAGLAAEAELATTLHSGSAEALGAWTEIATCQTGLRTGVRGVFPSRSLVLSPPRGFVELAQAQGYSTLLAADFAGAYLTQVPSPFERTAAPELTLSALANNSMLRTAAPLQALGLLPNLRRLNPSLTLNPGVADARYLVSDFLGLLEEAALDAKPVLATVVFSEPYASVRTDFPFLSHPMMREDDRLLTYARGLGRVDSALARAWQALEEAGWLRNAIVVVAGLRGFPFHEGGGTAVTSDAAFSSPLVLWTSGRGAESDATGLEARLARTIDVAPTLARRMGLGPFPYAGCDGAPLLDVVDKPPRFTLDAAYQESSTTAALGVIADSSGAGTASLSRAVTVDEGRGGRFFLRDGLEEILLQLRSRVWLTPKYRYVERLGPEGLRGELYDRERDPAGRRDALAEGAPGREENGRVAGELRARLHGLLADFGIPWVVLGAADRGATASSGAATAGPGLFAESEPR